MPQIDSHRVDQRHIWLIEQQPLSVPTFEYFKVAVEERPKSLELSRWCALLLAVVCSVDQVVGDLLLNHARRTVFILVDDLLDHGGLGEARPHDKLEFAHL